MSGTGRPAFIRLRASDSRSATRIALSATRARTGLADTAAVYVLFPDLPPNTRLAGVEFKVSFARPGRAGGGDIEARADLVKNGRTLAVVGVEVFQDESLLAKGLFTYMKVPLEPRSGDG